MPHAPVAVHIPGAAADLGCEPRLDHERRPRRTFRRCHVDADDQRQDLRVVPAIAPGRRVHGIRIRVAPEITEANFGDPVGENRLLRAIEAGQRGRRGIRYDPCQRQSRGIAVRRDGQLKIVDAATRAAGQHAGESKRVAPALEIQRLLGRLVQAQRMLRGQGLAQEFLGEPHVGRARGLGLAAVPAAGRQRQGAVEQRRHQREQHHSDDQLEQREPGSARPVHRSTFALRAPVFALGSGPSRSWVTDSAL